jgi:DNA replication and repair protein RecF
MITPENIEKGVDISPLSRIGVKSVSLRSFRNYPSLDVALSAGFNVVAGPNAQGKTNFLESLYLLSTTRLLRGQRDAEAVMDGSDKATVSAELLSTHTEIGITLAAGVRKRATLNSLSIPRASDLIGRLPSVCVSTVDMAIVQGEPTDRRLFLDLELSGLYPAYLRHFTLYKRALEQRNALLRDSKEWMQPGAAFEPWEVQIAHHGAAMRHTRREYLSALAPHAEEAHQRMGQGERLIVRYLERDAADTEEAMLEGLASGRHTDVARGGTSVGPHRDDLVIEIEGREARLFGSQGQQRTSVISLKLATLELGRQELGMPPLLLLDDILSDLDERRRALLVEIVLERAGQAVLTCTEASAAGEDILSEARVFQVCAGRMEPA